MNCWTTFYFCVIIRLLLPSWWSGRRFVWLIQRKLRWPKRLIVRPTTWSQTNTFSKNTRNTAPTIQFPCIAQFIIRYLFIIRFPSTIELQFTTRSSTRVNWNANVWYSSFSTESKTGRAAPTKNKRRAFSANVALFQQSITSQLVTNNELQVIRFPVFYVVVVVPFFLNTSLWRTHHFLLCLGFGEGRCTYHGHELPIFGNRHSWWGLKRN